MRNKSQPILLAIIVLLCGASAATADIKVKTKTSVSGQSFEGTTYIKKARQRTEQNMAGMSMAIITQCDERRTIQLNDKARTYLVMPFGNDDSTGAPQSRGMTVKPKSESARRGGVVTTVYNVSDTGERKQMFGMTARHLKITMTTESSPDACNPTKMKMEMDGWYVDLEYGLDCQWGRGGMGYSAGKPDCMDEYRMKTVGAGKLGYPLIQTMITYGDDGREMSRMTSEVVELSQATLDAALFDIPAGYTEAKNMQELYTGAATSSTPRQSDKTDDYNYAASRASKPNATATSATGSTSATVTVPGLTDASVPKKAGAIRIGLIMPKAQMSEGVSPSMAAEGVRNTFVGYLNGPSIEVIALNARMPAQAIEEARQSQCDYVLFSGITQKKGGGMFGKIAGNIGGAVASNIPYGGSAGEAAARTAAATAIYTTATIASSVKAKDEVSLEYKLQTTDPAAKPIVETTGKAKAKSDGEDVITPLVEKAAQTIVATVKR